ncbi:MAG: hypothetical protein DMG49_14895 [Acidobacteria bacterium]|nr:MAG: hypothetical protein DMG49_14895 [Acidobacteriota bacterium]
MFETMGYSAAPGTTGIVLHRAFWYDAFVWLVSFGREHSYREKTLDLAGLKPGESILDIGCGTGTLAIAAKRRVGAAGRVYAVDASPEMLARGVRKPIRLVPRLSSRMASSKPCRFPTVNSMRYCPRSCFIIWVATLVCSVLTKCEEF